MLTRVARDVPSGRFTSIACQSWIANDRRSWPGPSATRGSAAWCGSGCPRSTRAGRRAGPCRSTLRLFIAARTFCGVAGQRGRLQRGLDHQAGDEAFGQIRGRIGQLGAMRRRADLRVDRQVVLEQRVGADHVELAVLDAGQLLLGVEVRPGDVAAVPAQAPQGLERAHLRHPRRPRVDPVRVRVLQLGGVRRVVGRGRRRDLLVDRRSCPSSSASCSA